MGKPLVSVILASIRPLQLARCLASIERYTVGIDHEVVVISPFDIEPHPNVVHVKEAKPEGMYKAVAMGYERVRGEYIILLSDDTRATPRWVANMIEFMRPHDGEIFQGHFRDFAYNGENPEWTVYGKLYANFFCIRKDVTDRIGGVFDCYLRSFWGDPDLSLRVWHSGGKVETCLNAWVYACQCDDVQKSSSLSRYDAIDYEAFVQRWYPIYAQPGESRTLSPARPRTTPTLSPELPPEECVKLYVSLQRSDWKTVKSILASSRSDICVFPESLPILYDHVVRTLPSVPTPRRIFYLFAVVKWLRQQGYTRPLNVNLLKQSLLLHPSGWHGFTFIAQKVFNSFLVIVFHSVMAISEAKLGKEGKI